MNKNNNRQPFNERYQINDNNEKDRKELGVLSINQLLITVDTDLLKPVVFRCVCGHYPKYTVESLSNKTSEVKVKCSGCNNQVKRLGSVSNAFMFWNSQAFIIANHSKKLLPLFDIELDPQELKESAAEYKACIEQIVQHHCSKSELALLKLLKAWAQHSYSIGEYLSLRPTLNGKYQSIALLIKAIIRQLPEEFDTSQVIEMLSISTGYDQEKVKTIRHIISGFAQRDQYNKNLWRRNINERSIPGVNWVKNKKRWKTSHTDTFENSVQIYNENILEAIKLKILLCLCDGKTPYQRSNKKVTAGANDLQTGVSLCKRRNSLFFLTRVKNHTGKTEFVKEFHYKNDISRIAAKAEAHTWRLKKIDETNKAVLSYFEMSMLELLSELPEYNIKNQCA